MSLLVLTSADIENITSSISPDELQNVMKTTFAVLSAPKSETSTDSESASYEMPHRISVSTRNHTALVMPARINMARDNTGPLVPIGGTAIKTACVPKSSKDTRGLPASTIIIDEDTGAVKAIVNARTLTALRNAGGSLLSTTLIGPKAPTRLVAFGAGTQIQAHLQVFLKAYPTIQHVTIVNRSSNSRLESLINSQNTQFPHIHINSIIYTYDQRRHVEADADADNSHRRLVNEAVSNANIIICATSSTAPLFPSSWVKSGTHVILIGSYTPSMKEVDNDLIMRAIPTPSSTAGSTSTSRIQPILLVDSRAACAKEAGELISASIRDDQVVEIGEYAIKSSNGGAGVHPQDHPHVQDQGQGEPNDNEDLFKGPVTIFKSVGVGVQDVAIACAAVEKAKELGVGTYIEHYD